MSGKQSSTHATGRATAATTAAGGLKAAQDQIRALLADKATDKREAAAATKAAQKAAEKVAREAVASALAGHQPPLRQPPHLPPDDEEAFHGANDRSADEDRELKERLWNALKAIERLYLLLRQSKELIIQKKTPLNFLVCSWAELRKFFSW